MAARVGIFDSGVGGLSVVAALHRHQPSLDITYVADTAFFPYGGRDASEVAERARALTQMLVARNIDALVVACNTASSAALELLREEFDLPIIGMEPPLKPAVEASRSGVVAVLATPGTAAGQRMARLHERFGTEKRVHILPMPGLADLVEAGEVEGARVEAMIREALVEPLDAGLDALALGCTHYGFLRPVLSRLLPEEVRVIDAADPVARRTRAVLAELGFDPDAAGEPREVLCYATGDPAGLEATIEGLRRGGAALPPLNVGRPELETA
ncbi:MAG: glutamate racemase [Dehalococcoidia bacterium]